MNCGLRVRPTLARWLGLCALVAVTSPALAATEIYIDGYQRFRARLYDNLALNRELAESDDPAVADTGSTSYFQQRLRIQPELRVNEHLSVFAQVDVLPNLIWGANPERLAGLDEYYDPIGQSQSFLLPEDIPAVWPRRVWAEIYTPLGRLKVGRTAMQVGTGVYFNDGNDIDADYGDTADRVQFLTRIGRVYALLGYDMVSEGDPFRANDAQAGAAAVAYRSELLSGSFYVYYLNDQSWIDEGNVNAETAFRNDMNIWTLDLWGKAAIGPVDLELEAIYRYGSGDMVQQSLVGDELDVTPRVLSGVSLSQFGGIARARYNSRLWKFGLETGLASGDADETTPAGSIKLNRFTFDRDYHIALLMFREPLPTRAPLSTDTSPNDIYEDAVTGNAVSNAIYLVPSLEFNIMPNVSARLNGVAAWAMETSAALNQQKDYGYEIDLTLDSRWFDALTVRATGALLFPGGAFGDNQEFAFGGQILTAIEF